MLQIVDNFFHVAPESPHFFAAIVNKLRVLLILYDLLDLHHQNFMFVAMAIC